MVSGLVQAPWKHQVELVEGGSPAAGGQGSPGGLAGVLDAEVAAAQVEQLDQGVVVGEVPAGLADLAELVVDALDHVRGVEHPADLGGEREERDDLLPGGLPLPFDGRVLAADLAVGPPIEGL